MGCGAKPHNKFPHKKISAPLICTPKVRHFWGAYFYGKKGQIFRKYSAEFKIGVIMDMRDHHLGLRETARKYEVTHAVILKWERIFLEEGAEGLMKERRGRACSASGTRKGRPPNAFIDELKKYIHYYNNERISLKLKGMSPVQYRTHSQAI